MRVRRGIAVVALLALIGCGDDAPPGFASDTQLHLEVTPGEDQAIFETAILTCDDNGARGTGFLTADADATAACDALERKEVQDALKPPPADRICTEQYGGPQKARIVGTVGDLEVERDVDRANGCGIADWATLMPLLGPASDDPTV